MEHPVTVEPDERRAQRSCNADVYSLLVERSRRRFGGSESLYTPPAPEAA